MPYKIVLDKVILNQLKKLGTRKDIKNKITFLLDKLECKGERSGTLLDTKLLLYEIKMKRPPLRLYFKKVVSSEELYVFEYEMKTSQTQQNVTIQKLKKKISKKF